MKKVSILLMVMVVVLSASAVQAQERQLFKVNVPFSFQAEDVSFPAGSYFVYLLNPFNQLRLQSPDGHHIAVVRGFPSRKSAAPKESVLVFSHIDGQFFLTAVQRYDDNIQHELPLGSHARELLAKERVPGYRTSVSVSAR